MPSITKYLGSLFEDDEFADVTVVLRAGPDAQSLRLHSLVLRRSEYFKTALSSGFKEGATQRIELNDTEPRLMQPLLRALYTDELCDGMKFEEYFTMQTLCSRYMMPDFIVKLVESAFVRSLKPALAVDGTCILDTCWLLLNQCSGLATYAASLHDALRAKVVWGKNGMRSLVRAYQLELPDCAEICLSKITFDGGKIDREFESTDYLHFEVGSVVEVIKNLKSNSKIERELRTGLCGTIIHIDDDGDAEIEFEGIGHEWVFSDQFCKLRACQGAGGPCTGAVSSKLMAQAKMAAAEKICSLSMDSHLKTIVRHLSSSICSLISGDGNEGAEPEATTCSSAPV